MPVVESTIETAVVTKYRPVGGANMYAVGGGDSNSGVSSVERYDEGKSVHGKLWRV